MGDENDRALIIIQGLRQGFAAIHVEMISRLIKDHQMRPGKSDKPKQQARFFPAGEFLNLDISLFRTKTNLRCAGANLRFSAIWHEWANMINGALAGF